MTGAWPNPGNGALLLALCAGVLCALLWSDTSPVRASALRPSGECAPAPSWVDGAALTSQSNSPLGSCFSSGSSHAEAELSLTNNRPYAQLIILTGAQLDLTESAWSASLDRTLGLLLSNTISAGEREMVLLGPGQRATIAIDRPPPGAAREVKVDPAPDNPFAVAALAYRLLSVAVRQRSMSVSGETCVLTALRSAVTRGLGHPESAVRRIHACLNATDPRQGPHQTLRSLAHKLLRGRFFEGVIRRQGRETNPAHIAYVVPATNPNLINPDIHLGPANFSTVPSGTRTIESLTATGGAPPYRFYVVPEPGGPPVPRWLRVAADGTVTIEPPLSSVAVMFAVEVVDSNGEHSVVPY